MDEPRCRRRVFSGPERDEFSTSGRARAGRRLWFLHPVRRQHWLHRIFLGDSFEAHFGPGDSPQQRLLQNLKAAGVDQRASIATADMRKLPFEDGSFDAIVSSYAVDHLNREGINQTLGEAARVLKPGGDFLLMLVANDRWVKFAFGPLLSHGGTRGPAWWEARVKEAGFQVLEQGTTPATLYFLLRR